MIFRPKYETKVSDKEDKIDEVTFISNSEHNVDSISKY